MYSVCQKLPKSQNFSNIPKVRCIVLNFHIFISLHARLTQFPGEIWFKVASLTKEAEGADEDKYFDVDIPQPSPIMHTSWQWSC